MNKRASTAIAALFAVAAGLFARPASAAGTLLDAGELRCEYAYAYCVDTGDVIMDKNAGERTAMASLTKIMTALVTVETCADLDAEITVSEQAIAATPALSSTADLVAGERMTVRDMLYCMMLPSGNDAANVLAEHCGGSIEAFVEQMNRRAQELGCADTQFRNPHGFDEEGHYSTAADMAKILTAALKKPDFKKVYTTFSYVVPKTNLSAERNLRSTNRMTDYTSEAYSPSITGTKTGFTGDAGYCLACTGQVGDGPEFISVVLGGGYPDGASVPDSYLDTAYLLETATERFQVQTLHSQGDPLGTMEVGCLKGGDSVGLQAQDDLAVLMDGELAGRGVTASLSLAELTPPFYERQRVGTVVYTDADGEVLAEGGVVTASAGEYSRWKGFWQALGDIPAWQYICIVLGAAVLAFVLLLLVQALRRRLKRYYRRRGMLPHGPAAGAPKPKQPRCPEPARRHGKTRGREKRGKQERPARASGTVSRLWSDLNSGPTTAPAAVDSPSAAPRTARPERSAPVRAGSGAARENAGSGSARRHGGDVRSESADRTDTGAQAAPLQAAPSQAAPLQAAPAAPGVPVQPQSAPAEYEWRSPAYRPARTEAPAPQAAAVPEEQTLRADAPEPGASRERTEPVHTPAAAAPRDSGLSAPGVPEGERPAPERGFGRPARTEAPAPQAAAVPEEKTLRADAPVDAWDKELLVPFLFDDASAAWQERERRSMRAAAVDERGDGPAEAGPDGEALRRAMAGASPALRRRMDAQYRGAVENRRAAVPPRAGALPDADAAGEARTEDAPESRTARARTEYPRARRRRKRRW